MNICIPCVVLFVGKKVVSVCVCVCVYVWLLLVGLFGFGFVVEIVISWFSES